MERTIQDCMTFEILAAMAFDPAEQVKGKALLESPVASSRCTTMAP